MEAVDLSHYDLKDRFTAFEISNLIAGDEPESSSLSTASARARVFYEIIKGAYARACVTLHMKLIVEGSGVVDENVFFGILANPHMLPSCSLWAYWNRSQEDEDFKLDDDLLVRYPFESQFFLREDIEKWLSLTGYKGARYFIKSENTSKVDSEDLALNLSSEEIERLQKENAELKEKLVELNNELIPTRARNSLLVIIAALCDYSDIKIKERGAAVQIAKFTEEIGAGITDDTVRGILSQIDDAVERRKR